MYCFVNRRQTGCQPNALHGSTQDIRSGSGALLVVRFQGVQAGASTPLQLANVILGQPRGVVFPADTTGGDGLITVVAGLAAATTPIPSQLGNRSDLDVTLTAMAGQPAAEAASTAALPATAATSPVTSEGLSGLRAASLGVVGCLILLLLAVLAFLVWRLRRKDEPG